MHLVLVPVYPGEHQSHQVKSLIHETTRDPRDLMTARTTTSRQQNTHLADGAVERLVKSRYRVKMHGEVFTPQSMVNRMLDLVRPELETGPRFVDKTFFEPAAGDGNFLITILHRKLKAIEKRYQPEFWHTESLFALASIYGIELLEDNYEAAKAGMLTEFIAFHRHHGTSCGKQTNLWQAATFLVDSNIQRGNTLTALNPSGKKIEFSWWNRVLNDQGMVQREPFTFASLRNQHAGMFDFDVLSSYAQCCIDRVHQEARTDV